MDTNRNRTRGKLLGFHGSWIFVVSLGWCPAALPVSGSASYFYNEGDQGSDDSMESEKLVGRKRRPRTKRENESVREETVEIERGRDKLAIRRHIRLDEQRITTCHLSARCFFRKLAVRRESAGSRHANHSIENAHAQCLFDWIEPWLHITVESQKNTITTTLSSLLLYQLYCIVVPFLISSSSFRSLYIIKTIACIYILGDHNRESSLTLCQAVKRNEYRRTSKWL